MERWVKIENLGACNCSVKSKYQPLTEIRHLPKAGISSAEKPKTPTFLQAIFLQKTVNERLPIHRCHCDDYLWVS